MTHEAFSFLTFLFFLVIFLPLISFFSATLSYLSSYLSRIFSLLFFSVRVFDVWGYSIAVHSVCLPPEPLLMSLLNNYVQTSWYPTRISVLFSIVNISVAVVHMLGLLISLKDAGFVPGLILFILYCCDFVVFNWICTRSSIVNICVAVIDILWLLISC